MGCSIMTCSIRIAAQELQCTICSVRIAAHQVRVVQGCVELMYIINGHDIAGLGGGEL